MLTDSGGIQEEAPSLGKPVLVMRDVTEARAVQAGRWNWWEQIRPASLPECRVCWKTQRTKPWRAHNPYGDGQAYKQLWLCCGTMDES